MDCQICSRTICRSVGVRLGRGEALTEILASSSQVAEGVSTAGVVVSLARTYRVSLPVLTAVAQVSRHFCQAVCECKVFRTERLSCLQAIGATWNHSQRRYLHCTISSYFRGLQ